MPSAMIIAVLNDRWRIVDDGVQWILQHRRSKPSGRATGWKARGFHRNREVLLRSIAGLCGPDTDTTVVRQLREWHP